MNYEIPEVWANGDGITHGIAIVLVAMSVMSWAVMVYKAVQLVRLKRQGTFVEQRFWKAQPLEIGGATLRRPGEGNPYQNLVEVAREARELHSDTHLKEALSPDEWLQRCLSVEFEEQVARMTSGLGVLASIGSTAPFVGLLGTVWGIYNALLNIKITGQSSLQQVAGPVGESLVITALGLFVAIPAVLGYNAVMRGNRGVMHKLARFRHELHAYLMSGERRSPGASREKRSEPHLVAGQEN